MRISEFFNTDVREFSLYDCRRSIADIRDGLKPVQRKILYGIQKGYGENKDSLQVSRLVGIITAAAGYHHGEVSCEKAVVGMAQDFSGSNNVNLLYPDGQFGSRLSPESGASRYIRTKFSDSFRKFFLKEDDIILSHLKSEDDGVEIEPEIYFPILPMILVNGGEGIGTGFAMNVLSYSPKDLSEQIKNCINGRKIKDLLPWWKDFKGTVERIDNEDGSNSIIIKGIIQKESATALRITELPIGLYADKYKEILNKLEDSGLIKDYEDRSTEKAFDILIKTDKETASLPNDKLLEKFKLIKKEKENLTFWINSKNLKHFSSISETVKWWTEWRLERYEDRRKKKIQILTDDIKYNTEKMRFIEMYIKRSQEFSKKTKDQLIDVCLKESFSKEHIEDFIQIKIYNMTLDAIKKLSDETVQIKKQLTELKKTTNKDIMIKELENLKI